METLYTIFRVLLILFGIGMVIFVHELGHFLLARWAKVLVERFSIGFGPILLSWRRGETEYALSAVPLGGYVKMLGQTDTPEVEEPIEDERSYQNKSVGARMAIISAGVVMNVLFGFVCFVVAFRLGVPYIPAIIGTAIPGQPAWQAGLRRGDEIVEINGHRRTDYDMLITEVMTTRPPDDVVDFVIERGGERQRVPVAPIQDEKKPQIGVLPAQGLVLPEEPTHENSPAAAAQNPGFEGGDRVLAVDGVPVESHWDFYQALYERRRESVTITVERKVRQPGQVGPRVDIQVGPSYFRTMGLRMRFGQVVAVQHGSPASRATDEAGQPCPIEPKDVIKEVDGVRIEDLDPMRLPDILTDKAYRQPGEPIELTVLRQDKLERQIKLRLVPERIPAWIDFPDMLLAGPMPVSIPALGLAYSVQPVAKVMPDGAAARAGLAKTEEGVETFVEIKQVEFIFHDPKAKTPKPIELKEGMWPIIFWVAQFPEVARLRLTVEGPDRSDPRTVELTPIEDPQWPRPMRGLWFASAQAERREATIGGAIWAGLELTWFKVVRIYLQLRGLLTGTISPKLLVGPPEIFEMAYQISDELPLLIFFLGMLSVNLAVINFLPIPILDGGHMVFLAWELVARRPPSEKVRLAANYLGLFLILSLMVFVIGKWVLEFFV